MILTIVIPNDTLMLPLYTQFRNFDIFGIIHLVTGHGINLLSTEVPMYIMTALGCGLRSGLYIYIFNQFFRGLPKEIEEAAVVDGAGSFYTYFRIMLVNAMPSVLTVSIFSLVWQYNDTFYAKLFSINSKLLMSMRISTLRGIDRVYRSDQGYGSVTALSVCRNRVDGDTDRYYLHFVTEAFYRGSQPQRYRWLEW